MGAALQSSAWRNSGWGFYQQQSPAPPCLWLYLPEGRISLGSRGVLGLREMCFPSPQTNMPFLSIYLLALEQDMEHGTSVLQAALTLQHQTFLQVRGQKVLPGLEVLALQRWLFLSSVQREPASSTSQAVDFHPWHKPVPVTCPGNDSDHHRALLLAKSWRGQSRSAQLRASRGCSSLSRHAATDGEAPGTREAQEGDQGAVAPGAEETGE